MTEIKGYSRPEKIYESPKSSIYRAIRDEDGISVILKILGGDYPAPHELARYRQEYEIASGFDSEGIIKPYSIEKYHNSMMIIFEDFGAESLKKLLNSKEFTLEEFLEIAIRINEISGEMHSAGVMHKDINPSNIVLNPETGQVKIIDFGISTVLPRESPEIKNPETLEGTLAYISPEQTGRMNRSLDFRTDFYSLGVSFYEILTGSLPFHAETPMEMVHCHIAKIPVSPHEMKKDIPKPVSDIVMKLMSKNSEQRYQSDFGIRADLKECLDQLCSRGVIEDFPIALEDIPDRFQIPQKLYGREKEIDILAEVFKLVCSEKSAMIMVSGYSGVGKTALIREIYKPVTLKNAYFISGKFDQFQRNIPYIAVLDAFSDLMKQILSESNDSLLVWRKKLLSALDPNARVIIDVIPELELIVEKQPDVPELEATQAKNRFNYAFQNFIGVFTGSDRPLVIFLDDLQWADMSSLELLQNIMSDQKKNLLIIGAYRDNEVIISHPLITAIDELEKSGIHISKIKLLPLQLPQVCQLISETFYCNIETAKPLAGIVQKKTRGNPFFIYELLKSLYDDQQIDFDHHSGTWKWSLQKIESVDISDNVVELAANRIQKLSDEAQRVLKFAACMGNTFDLETLACISEQKQKETGSLLHEAVAENMIFPLSDAYKLIGINDEAEVEYKFSHDRIQQAAYSLIPEDQKQVLHRQIGLMLLKNVSMENREERIFDIINQLNQGIDLIIGNDEKHELAGLNLMAGKKAKASAAYKPAFDYFKTGIRLLEEESWKTHYDIALNLWSEAGEAAYLCSEFEMIAQYAREVEEKSENLLDCIKVYEARIMALIAGNKPQDAIDTGISVLQSIGEDLPRNPDKQHIMLELAKMKEALEGKNIEDLIDLPVMTDPSKKAVMRILVRIGSAAYLSGSMLSPLIFIKRAILSLKFGNTSMSVIAYGSIGIVFCGKLEDFDSGYRFGKLSLRMLERFGTDEYKTRIYFLYNTFVRHWKEHFDTTLKPLKDGYQSGLNTGDIEYAFHCITFYCLHSYFAGRDISVLIKESASAIEVISRLKYEVSNDWNQSLFQTMLNLTGRFDDKCSLSFKTGSEEKILENLQKVGHKVALFTFYLLKIQLYYLFEKYEESYEYSVTAEKYSDGAVATVLINISIFYDSLIHIALYDSAEKSDHKAYMKKICSNQEKIKKWAHHAPMNYLHKWTLVEAELARILNQDVTAIECYAKAAGLAKEYGYIQDEALANELHGKFWLAKNNSEIAEFYLKKPR